MIPEVALPTNISLIFAKKCSKVISQIENFIFFVIRAHNEQKVTATSMASTQSLSLQHKEVDRIMEEYRHILSSPTKVLTHCQVKHPIDLTPSAPLPNGPFYHLSLMENNEIRSSDRRASSKGAHQTQLLPLRKPDFIGAEEG
jgi:hypothetical protein